MMSKVDLKLFIEENQDFYLNSFVIVPIKYISKIRTKLNQRFDENLLKVPEFEFIITENFIDGFGKEGTLVESLQDWISEGHYNSTSVFKLFSPPITLSIMIPKIIKKTLSIFWHLKNKNLKNLIWNSIIPRSKSLSTKSEITLLCIIRKIKTLKSLTLTLSQNTIITSYTFKNLTPSRLTLIVDSVYGHNPSLPTPANLPRPIDMKSLITITDFISIIN